MLRTDCIPIIPSPLCGGGLKTAYSQNNLNPSLLVTKESWATILTGFRYTS